MWRDRYKIGEWGEDENKYGEERAAYDKSNNDVEKAVKMVKVVKAVKVVIAVKA